MCKKICFLTSLILVFIFCVFAEGAVPIDDPSYNLSFEWHWPDACDVVTQIYGHTGIDASPPTPSLDDPNQGVWNWLSTGAGFQGVDVFCPEALDSPTHCHQFPATDGICFVYLQHLGNGISQVLDGNDANAVIAAGRQYTLKFDALDMGTTGVRGEFYSASVDPIVSESFILPEILQPIENCDAGETELESNCVDFHRDLTVSFIALEGAAFLGEPLSIRFEANSGGNYTFMDNVRLEWMWLTPAYYPNPEDGAEDVAQDATLSWNPGLWARSVGGHEVYFGTSWSDVNDANTSDLSGIYRGAQNRDVNSYSPTEIPYELGKTYYWRVDEVNTAFVGPPAAAPDAEGRWRGDVWSFEVTGYATNPSPADGAEDESIFAVLSWTPGTSSESHDIYFGTDFDEVNEADDSDANVYKGNQVYGANSWDPPGLLDLGQSYYWRIDELRNGGADILKGKIWSFKVAEFLVVDDMESYEGGTNEIFDTWIEDFSTQAFVTTSTEPNYVTTPFGQSMRYQYRNSISPHYSEITRTFSSSQDWTAAGFKTLTLYVRADMLNDSGSIQPMYVRISDGSNTGTVYYDDPNDMVRSWAGWQEWNIDMQDFVIDGGVNLASVTSMTIGAGTPGDSSAGDGYVYIDDIRLYPSRCVIEKATGSFTSDCDVDGYDLGALARDWLVSGIGSVTATTAPSTDGLFGHWPMDDSAPTLVVTDISGNGNDGLLFDEDRSPGRSTAKHSEPGIIGTALSFDGFDDYVEVPALNVSSNTITLTAWIKRDAAGGHIYDGIVMSSDACEPNYTAGLQFGSDTETWEANYELSYMWTGYSWEWHTGLFVPPEAWAFTALTVAPDVATIYLYDGITMRAARSYDTHEPKPWTAAFHIGDQMQYPGRFFPGLIDDVRIYNRTLTAEEILYLALQGPGSEYISLPSWRADANADEKVDYKDFAVMADGWLSELLWP